MNCPLVTLCGDFNASTGSLADYAIYANHHDREYEYVPEPEMDSLNDVYQWKSHDRT